jgi:hypothetical protein
MKTYTLEVTVSEGNDEFWESISGSGCDEVTEAIQMALSSHGFYEPKCTVILKRFEQQDG